MPYARIESYRESLATYSNPRISFNNWLTGYQEEPLNRCHSCSASAQTMEALPPDMRYQARTGNEYNHLGLLYKTRIELGDL